MQGLLAGGSASPEVAELLKLGFKAFWSATYMEIPAPLAEPTAFSGWMTVLHTFVQQQVPEVRLTRAMHTVDVSAQLIMCCRTRACRNVL